MASGQYLWSMSRKEYDRTFKESDECDCEFCLAVEPVISNRNKVDPIDPTDPTGRPPIDYLAITRAFR